MDTVNKQANITDRTVKFVHFVVLNSPFKVRDLSMPTCLLYGEITPIISDLKCFNPLLRTLSSSSFFRYRSIVSTSATLKKEGLLPSLSSLPNTGWKIMGKFLFGNSSQPSITFLWKKHKTFILYRLYFYFVFVFTFCLITKTPVLICTRI